jgi:hypothetical protein
LGFQGGTGRRQELILSILSAAGLEVSPASGKMVTVTIQLDASEPLEHQSRCADDDSAACVLKQYIENQQQTAANNMPGHAAVQHSICFVAGPERGTLIKVEKVSVDSSVCWLLCCMQQRLSAGLSRCRPCLHLQDSCCSAAQVVLSHACAACAAPCMQHAAATIAHSVAQQCCDDCVLGYSLNHGVC